MSQPPIELGAECKIALYGRTYWDARVEVPLETLGTGKGKVDARVSVAIGGFACNAARAIAGDFSAGSIHVVTAASWLDVPRLRASLPDPIELDAIAIGKSGEIDAASVAPPPISIVINPADACRILRDPMDDADEPWQLDRVPAGALSAHLHVLGRLPVPFVSALCDRIRSGGAKLAWCGGYALPDELEKQCDIMCVNSKEARRLLGAELTPRQCAEALARRAEVSGAVRVVTGGGATATAAAIREGDAVRCHEAPPGDVAKQDIKRLLGVGDAFAAKFLATACFDASGQARHRLDIPGALAAAQATAAEFITQPMTSEELTR